MSGRPPAAVAPPWVCAANRTEQRRLAQRGVSMLELVVVVALAGAIVGVTVPAIWNTVTRQQARVVAAQARSLVRSTHMKAIKEKAIHRVVFRDDSATPANTIEVQREQGGTFVTLPGQVYRAPQGVRILGSGSTDSVDQITVGTRGECDAGGLFIQGRDGSLQVVAIDATCHTRSP